MSHASDYLSEVADIAAQLEAGSINAMVKELAWVRERCGRLYVMGLGGSSANASHACNDFRKLCALEAYCPTDNVAEFTAKANDEGWTTVFTSMFWKRGDALMVLSVGGGTLNTSFPLCIAIDGAKARDMRVLGIVGRDGGYTKKKGDCVIVIPTVNEKHVTPHTEAFQGVVWHLLVSHPLLKVAATKWESTP